MKKVLKILIPLVLILGLLAGAVWFFLFYNRELTADILTDNADRMAAEERYDRAVTYYNWAWQLLPDRTGLPLSLAETYAASGNYTKAEYTLVSAISARPNSYELYAALSRIYVEQDKLLDAVQMLDRVTSQTVLEELVENRPAAPVVMPESGYYTEYISVSAESPDAVVYLTTNGEYPADDSAVYSDPVSLPSGESTVIAIAVNEEGLVSSATMNGYTIGGVVEAVELADPAVDTAVRELLHKSLRDTIMTDDLWSIAALELPDTVKDLQDLVHFTGLKTLSVQNVSGLDFTVLRQLTGLNELNLSGCSISSNSLDAIGSLTELRRLSLESCAIYDLSPLSQLTKLTELRLAGNTVTDIGVLSLMLDLETVDLANNPIASIAGLSTCSKLKYVDITGCGITALGSLSGKKELVTLLADDNQIADLSSLATCRSLSELSVSNNLLQDITVLASLPELTSFTGNNNHIKNIPDFYEESSKLVRFIANYNEIEDLSGLAGILTLNYVKLDYNQIKDIQPLANSYNLIQLDVWDNPIPEITEAVKVFEESSIIVNYNPNFEVPEETTEE